MKRIFVLAYIGKLLAVLADFYYQPSTNKQMDNTELLGDRGYLHRENDGTPMEAMRIMFRYLPARFLTDPEPGRKYYPGLGANLDAPRDFSVLDPGAGDGRLLDYYVDLGMQLKCNLNLQLDFCEIHYTRSRLCNFKGYKEVAIDFLRHVEQVKSGEVIPECYYDLILGNFPFMIDQGSNANGPIDFFYAAKHMLKLEGGYMLFFTNPAIWESPQLYVRGEEFINEPGLQLIGEFGPFNDPGQCPKKLALCSFSHPKM